MQNNDERSNTSDSADDIIREADTQLSVSSDIKSMISLLWFWQILYNEIRLFIIYSLFVAIWILFLKPFSI